MYLAVLLQILDRNDLQIPFLRLLKQLCGTHHRSIIPHDLTAQTAFLQSGQTAQIHSALSMSIPLQDAGFCQQWKHMSRTSEVLRLGAVFHTLHRRQRPLCCRDPRCRIHMINGHCKRSLMVICVVAHHLRQMQLLNVRLTHRHTDQSLCMHRHEVDILGCRKLRRTDQISFIFSIRVINHHDQMSLAKLLKCFFYGIKITHCIPPFRVIKSRFRLKIPS